MGPEVKRFLFALQAEDYDPALKQGAVLNTANDIALTEAYIIVGNASGKGVGVAVSGDVTISNAGVVTIGADKIDDTNIIDDAISLEHLDAGITPSHLVKYAGTHIYAGGGTSDAATVTGVAATDIVLAVIKASTNAVSIVKAVPTTNTVTFHFSADPGASTEVFYIVLNAAA